MSFLDKIKAKADELDLHTKAAQAQEAAKKAAAAATEKAAELADKHGDKVSAHADTIAKKAGEVVNQQTGGKYAQHIEKAQGAVASGITKGTEKLAEQSPAKSGTTPAADGPVVTGGEHEHHTHIESEDRNF